MLIDRLASDAGVECKRKECRSLVVLTQIDQAGVKLVKPQTFMNLSGEAVSCLVTQQGLSEPGRNLIVISDDLALPFGTIRIRERGSAGGHNGLKSIIASLGTNEFVRLRIGIQPEHSINDTKSFVLDTFSRSARKAVEEIIERSADALRTILRDGVLKAMSQHNSDK
jgi:PTH1 family peptidyl-tRNA hydrolase